METGRRERRANFHFAADADYSGPRTLRVQRLCSGRLHDGPASVEQMIGTMDRSLSSFPSKYAWAPTRISSQLSEIATMLHPQAEHSADFSHSPFCFVSPFTEFPGILTGQPDVCLMFSSCLQRS